MILKSIARNFVRKVGESQVITVNSAMCPPLAVRSRVKSNGAVVTKPVPHYVHRFRPALHRKKVSIAKAVESDKEDISKFMSDVFFKTEPSSIICGVAEKDSVSAELLEMVTEGIDEHMSFVAKPALKDKTLAGVAINSVRPTTYEPNHWNPLFDRVRCNKERELLFLWKELSSLPREATKHFGNASKVFELEYLTVHPSYQRQGLAKAMLMESIKEAKKKGYQYIRMDCTSAFSARLGENVGMKRIEEVYYEELKDSKGKTYRNVKPPHIKAAILIAYLDGIS